MDRIDKVLLVVLLSAVSLIAGLEIVHDLSDKNTGDVTFVADQREIDIFYLSNLERDEKLEYDECLSESARTRAAFLNKNKDREGYWAHHAPDGTDPWQFIKHCGYKAAGENLSQGFDNAADIHNALMESESHRENILNKAFNKIGIGCNGDICVEYFTN